MARTKFEWSNVSTELVRAFLTEVYEAQGDDELDKVRELTREQLLRNAKRSLGSPPHARFFNSKENYPAVIEMLRSRWLRKLDKEQLTQVARQILYQMSSPPKVRLETKRACLEFLLERRATPTYRKLLRKAFLRAHQSKVGASGPRKKRAPPKTLHVISGRGEPPRHRPWKHQEEAWAALERAGFGSTRRKPVRGLVVLPTGSGKTDVAVTWLLRNALNQSPPIRVLWLAHQQELLDQALERLRLLAQELPSNARLNARVFHSEGASINALSASNTDAAFVTVQSLARDFEAKKMSKLEAYLTARPTIVVVDEAHHGGSPTYFKVLKVAAKHQAGLLGLTATPVPTSPRGQARLRKHFPPKPMYKANLEELVQRQILARQITETIRTNFEVELTAEDRVLLERYPDIRSEILRKLDRDKRNAFIVQAYLDGADRYGKTLVYATSINHAEKLTEMLVDERVKARVLHSAVDDRREPLEWFKKQKKKAALVSVGMLTEGIDLPDAKTVLLARPTTSRILLKQMIGRALRGPEAGGELYAHVVSFEDYWQRFTGILGPEDVLEGEQYEFNGEEQKIFKLPPLILDDGVQAPRDVAAHIKRMYASMPYTLDIMRSPLAGWYKLDDRHVAVFEHQVGAVERFLTAANQDMTGSSLLSFFTDVPDPVLAQRDLSDLRDYVRLHNELPVFIEVRDSSTPRDIATALCNEGAMDPLERSRFIEAAYMRAPSRLVYPSLEAFESAVDREVRRIARGETPFDGHVRNVDRSVGKPNIPFRDRDLKPLLHRVEDWILENLDSQYHARLRTLPPVKWSSRVAQSYYGAWTYTRSGKNAGKAIITVNSLLSASRTNVSDHALEFLIYHEVLHHLLPFQGHDTDFFELESRWPNADTAQAELHTLGDRWDLRPESYRRRDSRRRAERRPVYGRVASRTRRND